MTQRAFQIKLSPSGRVFVAEPGRTILESGLSAGIALPFACANGSCGTCRAKILEGATDDVRFYDYPLTAAQKLERVELMCSTVATSDLVIEVQEALSVDDIPVQSLAAKKCRLDIREDVMVVAFKFSRGNALRFFSGQWVDLEFADGYTECLPVASCPCNAQYVEFHLPVAGSESARRLGDSGKRERVTVHGPRGQFVLSGDVKKPKIFIAVGEGFASVQGLIEHVINLELETDCVVLWQATDDAGHYFDNLCRSWADAFEHIDYEPVSTSANLLQSVEQVDSAVTASAEFYLSAPASFDSTRLAENIATRFNTDRVFVNSA